MLGFIGSFLVFTGCCPNGFHTQFIIGWKRETKRLFIAFWIADKTRKKSAWH